MRKLSRKADAGQPFNFLVIAIIVVIVIVLVVILIFRADIITWMKNLQGFTYGSDKDVTITDSDLLLQCNFKLARIMSDNTIKFCGDEKCSSANLVISELTYEGSSGKSDMSFGTLYLTDGSDKSKAGIVSNRKISPLLFVAFYKNPLVNVKGYSPDDNNYELLLNLEGAKLVSSYICRDSRVNLALALRTVKKINNKGVDFYFDVNEYIKKKNNILPLGTVQLYLDVALTKPANSWITKEGQINRQPEEGENRAASYENVILIAISNYDISSYYSDDPYLKDFSDGRISGSEPVHGAFDNSNDKLGIDMGGQNINYVMYKQDRGIVYIKFISSSVISSGSQSPWVLMDYWNEYQTFRKIPSWAILDENAQVSGNAH